MKQLFPKVRLGSNTVNHQRKARRQMALPHLRALQQHKRWRSMATIQHHREQEKELMSMGQPMEITWTRKGSRRISSPCMDHQRCHTEGFLMWKIVLGSVPSLFKPDHERERVRVESSWRCPCTEVGEGTDRHMNHELCITSSRTSDVIEHCR